MIFLYLTNMEKNKETLNNLWEHTAPIDSWILENIHFFKNGWGQQVMVGSYLVSHHEKDEEPDVIRYDRTPEQAYSSNNNALFRIKYYPTTCHFMFFKEQEGHVALEYANPKFFEQLEYCIWNARTIDYIISDLREIEKSAETIRAALLDNPTAVATKIGWLRQILDQTTQWNDKFVKFSKKFRNNELIFSEFDERY